MDIIVIAQVENLGITQFESEPTVSWIPELCPIISTFSFEARDFLEYSKSSSYSRDKEF